MQFFKLTYEKFIIVLSVVWGAFLVYVLNHFDVTYPLHFSLPVHDSLFAVLFLIISYLFACLWYRAIAKLRKDSHRNSENDKKLKELREEIEKKYGIKV